MNDPFLPGDASPLARHAADVVMAALRTGFIAPGLPVSLLHGPQGGKMFGVLVVEAADGRVGFLRALSGQLARSWDVEGYVPPVFDRVRRAADEIPGERAISALTARVEAVKNGDERRALREEETRLLASQALARKTLATVHAERRAARRGERDRLQAEGLDTPDALRALDRESWHDEVEHRASQAEMRAARDELATRKKRIERRLKALERLRLFVSRKVSWNLYETYAFENAHGARITLRDLVAPRVPASGTGDCAAPKLLVFARRHGLRPLALAEFWWGAPPSGGGRIEGAFFGACEEKCGPVLRFLLDTRAPLS